MKQSSSPRAWIPMTILATIAGVLYSSWPLGYVLNPAVSRKGLASALEALHQPYNWVFIAGDVISSVLVLLMCSLLWQQYRKRHHRQFLTFVAINCVVFALGTIADTLLPEHCLPGALTCPSWHQDHLLLAHGIFSIVASFCLFLALLALWWRNRTPLFYALMIGYTIFGCLTLYEAISPTAGNFSQHYYITLCSFALAVIPYGIYRTYVGGESARSGKKSTS